jgi:sulfur-carrier protein
LPVKILYFATVREAMGKAEESIDLPEGLATPSAVIDWLAGQSEAHALAFSNRAKLRCAVDQVMVALDSSLIDPKELAFFPPVTGG